MSAPNPKSSVVRNRDTVPPGLGRDLHRRLVDTGGGEGTGPTHVEDRRGRVREVGLSRVTALDKYFTEGQRVQSTCGMWKCLETPHVSVDL